MAYVSEKVLPYRRDDNSDKPVKCFVKCGSCFECSLDNCYYPDMLEWGKDTIIKKMGVCYA